MLKDNPLKKKWKEGKAVIGCQDRTGSPMIAELFGLCGFDFVFIENEHFVYDSESVLKVVQACDCGKAASILRIVDHDPGKILQYLDLGVSGLLLPHVDNQEQAKRIVSAGKYRPLGQRGFSNTSRATGYGIMDMEGYKKKANEQTLLISFIESKEAVENLSGILQSGIDAIHIGPGDLAESYGTTPSDPKIIDLIKKIINQCNEADIPCGIPSASAEDARKWLNLGVKMISFSSDLAILKSASCKILDQLSEFTG